MCYGISKLSLDFFSSRIYLHFLKSSAIFLFQEIIIIKLHIKAICCLEVTLFKAQFSLVTVACSDKQYRNASENDDTNTNYSKKCVPILMDHIHVWNGIVTLQIFYMPLSNYA